MSVNAVSNQYTAPNTSSAAASNSSAKEAPKTDSTSKAEDTGAVYEKSTSGKKTTYKQNTALVNQLKADAEQRTNQLRSLVEKIMTKQGQTIGTADDMWKFIAGGNFTVDAETKAQAQKDIAEDGYWGVEQTSDRIISFATALTGGDPDKIEEMRKAFEKGFGEATKSWGKTLPDISQRTYDAVMEKFDKMAQDSKKTVEEM